MKNLSTKYLIIASGIVALSVSLVSLKPEQIRPTSFRSIQEQFWQKEFDRIQAKTREPWQWWDTKKFVINPNMLDSNAVVWKTDKGAIDVVYRRTKALLSYLKTIPSVPNLSAMETHLLQIKGNIDRLKRGEHSAVSETEMHLFNELMELNRKISLSNPLLNFDAMIFVSRDNLHPGIIQANSAYNPVCGGGLYCVTGIKSMNPIFKNILAGSKVVLGSNKGEMLYNNPYRSFQEPDLSFDGKSIVFAYGDKSKKIDYPFVYNATPLPIHLYSVNVDGSNLKELTNSKWKDFNPCWMPDGRIVFISERGGIGNRCSGLYDYEPASTLYSMKADGSDLYPISYNEVNELYPSVDNQGRLVYTRWDYVDRDFNAGHHIWLSYPDGRDPRAPHGNYAYPHSTLDSTKTAYDGRKDRPWSEQFIRAVPGEASLYSAVASGHHCRAAGPIITIDISIPDDNKMSQVKIITGDGNMPQDGNYNNNGEPIYTTPWPLGQNFFIAAELNTRDVYLIDKFGNRTLLFTAPVDLPVYDPIPLRARRTPPVIPFETYQGERENLPGHKKAVLSLMNVYDSDFTWPKNARIKALRIIEIFPRPMEWPDFEVPNIGFGDGSNARMVLGTVPVEEDGSAYFEAPVGKAIYFQALDQEGRAVQSMRSATYVHAGEHLSCIGCHEDKWKASSVPQTRMALRRKPSLITPDSNGSMPFSYARLAKPVFEQKCIQCHKDRGVAFTNSEYQTMKPYAFYFHANGGSNGLEPVHGGYRTTVGRFGAIESKMGKTLYGKQHQEFLKEGKFTKEDLHRILLWLDCNSCELGAYDNAEGQRKGKVVWAKGVDPSNPTGVEKNRP